MAKLLTQDLTCCAGERCTWSALSRVQDRLNNWGEGEVDFMVDNNKLERLVNNLMAT